MINYSIPDNNEKTKNILVEATMIHNGAKSLVERCIAYLKRLEVEDFDLEMVSILVDHALIANGLKTLIIKAEMNP